jgi:hypothetical protein
MPRPDTTSIDCAVIAEAGAPIATVALADRVDPAHAPRPANESEQLLFRQLYETLIRIDCKGRLQPGLAESWRLDADTRAWIVTIRENARFSDGRAVMASDVRDAWMRDLNRAELQPQVGRLIEAVAAVDDRTLAITLRTSRPDQPRVLAHTDLAIARIADAVRWPLGTRTDGAAAEDDRSDAAARSMISITRNNLPTVRFLTATGDPRDLLDTGPDLLLTRDHAALEYAATLPQFAVVPLEWRTVHVLVTPGRARGAALTTDARQALATDAVRGEARGAIEPYWWQMPKVCDVAPPESRQPGAFTPRIVYDLHDAGSRDLAERLVGLDRRAYQQAVALAGEPLAATWRRGRDAAYVISLDRLPLEPCRDMHILIDSARWLDPETMVPLVETRLRAIVRRGTSGVIADGDGGLHLSGMNGSMPR